MYVAMVWSVYHCMCAWHFLFVYFVSQCFRNLCVEIATSSHLSVEHAANTQDRPTMSWIRLVKNVQMYRCYLVDVWHRARYLFSSCVIWMMNYIVIWGETCPKMLQCACCMNEIDMHHQAMHKHINWLWIINKNLQSQQVWCRQTS